MVEQGMPAVTYMETLAEGSLATDGTEQIIIEVEKHSPFALNAWLDLSLMEAEDTVIIRQYIKLKEGGKWIKYAEEVYPGIQSSPGLFITTKPSTHGIKITLEQNTGEHETIDYNVFQQRSAIDRGSIVFTS